MGMLPQQLSECACTEARLLLLLLSATPGEDAEWYQSEQHE